MQAAENRRRSNVPTAEPVPLVVDVRVTNPGDIAPAVGVAISEPFWMKLPKVAFFWLRLLVFPFVVLKFLMEVAVCAILLGIFGVLGAWGAGLFTQEQVMPFIADFGDRTLALIRALGFPI